MYGQKPSTPINKFVHRLFGESKIPRSLITWQEFAGNDSVPAFEGLVTLKNANGNTLLGV